MGASQTTIRDPSDKPTFSKSKIKFVKENQLNNDQESDYDDELDSSLHSKDDIESNADDDDNIRGGKIPMSSLHGDGQKYFDDLEKEAVDGDTKQLIQRDRPTNFKKVFGDDDSVAQLDKHSSVASMRPEDVDRLSAQDMGVGGAASQPMIGKNESHSRSTPPLDKSNRFSFPAIDKKEAKLLEEAEPEGRHLRSKMDPQQRRALDDDIQRLREIGEMRLNVNGLLSFNRFMHLFIIITRHSKEQHIKEQRKVHHKRLRAFKLKNWKEYADVVQHELDMERIKYLDVVNYVLDEFEIPDGCYRASFIKYSYNRDRDLQMKDARQIIHREVEQRQLDCVEFNEEMIEKKECIKMIGFYEARKLDVLSILSNPHKHQFNKKNQFVLELAVEQAKIHDQIQMKYGKEFMLFIKAARHYGLMKSDGKMGGKPNTKDDLHDDAKAIFNQMEMNLDMDMSIN